MELLYCLYIWVQTLFNRYFHVNQSKKPFKAIDLIRYFQRVSWLFLRQITQIENIMSWNPSQLYYKSFKILGLVKSSNYLRNETLLPRCPSPLAPLPTYICSIYQLWMKTKLCLNSIICKFIHTIIELFESTATWWSVHKDPKKNYTLAEHFT